MTNPTVPPDVSLPIDSQKPDVVYYSTPIVPAPPSVPPAGQPQVGDKGLRQPTTVISLVALIVSAVSLMTSFNIYKNARYQSLIQIRGTLNTHSMKIGELVYNDPELYSYFYENQEIPTGDLNKRRRALIVTEMLLDLFDLIMASDLDEKTLSGWKEYGRDIYKLSPVFREQFLLREKWYPFLAGWFHDLDR